MKFASVAPHHILDAPMRLGGLEFSFATGLRCDFMSLLTPAHEVVRRRRARLARLTHPGGSCRLVVALVVALLVPVPELPVSVH